MGTNRVPGEVVAAGERGKWFLGFLTNHSIPVPSSQATIRPGSSARVSVQIASTEFRVPSSSSSLTVTRRVELGVVNQSSYPGSQGLKEKKLAVGETPVIQTEPPFGAA